MAQTTGMPPQSSYNKSNEQASEMALTRGGEEPFYRPDPYDKPVDRSKGKSMAFKALSRSEVNKLKGSQDCFQNDFNRYHVKYFDPKVHGNVKFD